ncbi:hypothetical protein [Pigmentiphaga daeguensis]|uniref:Uncharacterized protein n=1 Tax=Pigmentiphaga daeguensis TaxID=414049 RepID=A0ABN1BAF5_9BURK
MTTTEVYDSHHGRGMAMYRGALGFFRHADSCAPGKWRIAFTEGSEQWIFLGRPDDAEAVVDDFGSLVRVDA